jgi:hypothetical protein
MTPGEGDSPNDELFAGLLQQEEEQEREGAAIQKKREHRIRISNRHLPEMTLEALCALRDANEDPAWLFVRGGQMVFVDVDEKRIPLIRPITEHGLKGALARSAYWYRIVKKDKDDFQEVIAIPSLEIARDILSRPTGEWGLWPLFGVCETPILNIENGDIKDTEGYDLRTCSYYLPSRVLLFHRYRILLTRIFLRGKEIIEDIFCDFHICG